MEKDKPVYVVPAGTRLDASVLQDAPGVIEYVPPAFPAHIKAIADKHYFDGTDPKYENIACSTCDMGDAGYCKTRKDKHDDDCLVANVHDWLSTVL